MDLYCWAGVAILLIIGGVALMCLWSKSNTQGDDIQYLKDQRESDEKGMEEDFNTLRAEIRKVEVQTTDEFIRIERSTSESFYKVDEAMRPLEQAVTSVELCIKSHVEQLPAKVSQLEGSIATIDESVGILERRVSDNEEKFGAQNADISEMWKSKNDHERRIDAHEKRLNDQMSHILGDEKKLAVLGAKVDGQDAVTLVALEAFDVVAEVYKAALAAGTFTVVDEQVSSRGRKPRGKGKRVA